MDNFIICGKHKYKLEMFSQAYAWIIFAGFSIVPVGVLAQKYEIFSLFAPALLSTAFQLP